MRRTDVTRMSAAEKAPATWSRSRSQSDRDPKRKRRKSTTAGRRGSAQGALALNQSTSWRFDAAGSSVHDTPRPPVTLRRLAAWLLPSMGPRGSLLRMCASFARWARRLVSAGRGEHREAHLPYESGPSACFGGPPLKLADARACQAGGPPRQADAGPSFVRGPPSLGRRASEPRRPASELRPWGFLVREVHGRRLPARVRASSTGLRASPAVVPVTEARR